MALHGILHRTFSFRPSPLSAPTAPRSTQEAAPEVRTQPVGSGWHVPVWYGALLVAALLLASEPYRGVRHDAVLYLGQAVVRLDPSWWHQDFYFAFGSQDRYSLFSPLLARLVSGLGVSVAEIAGLTAGRVATFLALYLLTRGWTPLQRWLGLAAAAGFVHYYGGKTFAVLEPFLTARSFAEPLSLLAIAVVLRGHKLLGIAVLAAAMAFHPLISVPAVLAIWAYLVVSEDRRWIWAAAAVLPVLALAVAGVAPFDGLLHRYDDLWFQSVGIVDSPAFVSEWPYQAYVAIAGSGVVIWCATWGRGDPFARFSRVAAVLGPLCCATSFFFADYEHNILLTQLQFWRTIWLGELLSVLWVPVLVTDLWRRSSVGRVAAVAVCAGLPVIQDDLGPYGWAMLLWIVLWSVLSLRDVVIGRRILRLATMGTVLMGVIALGQHCWDALFMISAGKRGYALSYAASIPFRVPLLTLALTGLLLAAWQRRRLRPACAVLALGLATISAWQTDQRDAFTRFIETAGPAQRPFQTDIPKTATVFWEDADTAPVWFLLHRAGFAQTGQFSGLIFNRGTTMAARELSPFIVPVWHRTDECNRLQSWTSRDYQFDDCDASLKEVRGYCIGPGPHPDFIVSHIAYALPRQDEWRFVAPDRAASATYYLYACKAIQAQPVPVEP